MWQKKEKKIKKKQEIIPKLSKNCQFPQYFALLLSEITVFFVAN